MSKLFYILFLSFIFGKLDKYEPYLSPGLQIGLNSKREFFYGFQFSTGLLTSPKNYIYSTSICFGFKKYLKTKNKENYIDLQFMSLPDRRLINDGIPIGFGIGKKYLKGKSELRIKGYSWFISCITIDYSYQEKQFNISLIPVFPISEWM